MKNIKFKIIIISLLVISVSFLSFTDQIIPTYKMINDKVIKRNDGALYQKGIINIKFKDNVNASEKNFGIPSVDYVLNKYSVTNIVQRHPLNKDINKRMIGDDELAKIYAVYYSGNIDPTDLSLELYNSNMRILDWAEPDFVMEADFIPNDPQHASQWHIAKISSYSAWDLSQGDTSMVIGIVDSGSDLDHPDLAANIKYNYLENPTNGIDDDGNGFIDDWRGWDFAGPDYNNLTQDNDPNIYTVYCEHGSHVSGCASQVTNNGVGGAGIGFKCKLLISKHGADNDNTGGGYSLLYNTNNGIVYCYQNGAKVINCSFGSSTYSAYSQTVVNNAWANNSVICASAGNQSANSPRYPASYDNVISVAATNSSDTKAWFSNYHTTVDVCAPGESIYSTIWNNSYVSYDGTSMSAPIASGTVALIRSKFPTYTPAQVEAKLKNGVDSIYHLNPSYIGLLGTGRINAYKCLSGDSLLANFSGNPTTVSPGGSVNFTDLSTGSPTGWNWQFPGGTPNSSTVQNPTNIVYNTLGQYDVTLTITKNSQQHTLTKPNYINVTQGSQYIIDESFESSTFPPTGWTSLTPTGGLGWYRVTGGTSPVPGFTGGTVTVPPNGGSAVAFCNWQSGGTTSCDQWLITPQITNVQPSDSLTFWLRKFGAYVENFNVKISTTTPTVAAMTVTVFSQYYPATDSGWVYHKFNIGSLVPQGSNIYIGFREWVTDSQVDGASFSLDLVRVSRQSTNIFKYEDQIPKSYELSQNYPNPFNPVTNIKFALPKNSNVKLSVYDINGREIAVILNETKQAGIYTFTFDASKLASGVYFYRLTANDFSDVKRMILVK